MALVSDLPPWAAVWPVALLMVTDINEYPMQLNLLDNGDSFNNWVNIFEFKNTNGITEDP